MALKGARAERSELRKKLSSSNAAPEVPCRLLQTMRIEEHKKNREREIARMNFEAFFVFSDVEVRGKERLLRGWDNISSCGGFRASA